MEETPCALGIYVRDVLCKLGLVPSGLDRGARIGVVIVEWRIVADAGEWDGSNQTALDSLVE